MILKLDEVFKITSKLAKSNYYQTIYGNSKDIGIKLFKNDRDLTKLQVFFLNELSKYQSLFLDITLGEVDEIVLKDKIYEDAYLYYKRKKRVKQEDFKNVQQQPPKNSFQWIFRRKK